MFLLPWALSPGRTGPAGRVPSLVEYQKLGQKTLAMTLMSFCADPLVTSFPLRRWTSSRQERRDHFSGHKSFLIFISSLITGGSGECQRVHGSAPIIRVQFLSEKQERLEAADYLGDVGHLFQVQRSA
jgi:hypothetical protein